MKMALYPFPLDSPFPIPTKIVKFQHLLGHNSKVGTVLKSLVPVCIKSVLCISKCEF